MDVVVYNKIQQEADRLAQLIEQGGGDANTEKLAGPSGTLSYRWSRGDFSNNPNFSVDVGSIKSKFGLVDLFMPVSLEGAFRSATYLRTVEILNYNNPANSSGSGNYSFPNYAYAFYIDGGFSSPVGKRLKSVKIVPVGMEYLTPKSCNDMFGNNNELETIDCIFDMSKMNGYSYGYHFKGMFAGCSSLKEVRFAPNTLLWMDTSYQLFNVSQALSDASLVSIANALAVDSVAPNIKLLSTPYARCSTLIGTVTDGFFTQDEENGTVSLADFISNTKGWTLST